jgi:DNA-binding SARP family transcriptional activator
MAETEQVPHNLGRIWFMLAARSSAPYATTCLLRNPTFNNAVKNSFTLFVAAPGFLCVDDLATVLVERAKPILWLRIEPDDCDPATFLLSLIDAARQISPDIGTSTMTLMRRSPGPIYGWQPHFAKFGEELADNLPVATAIVFEHAHSLLSNPPILGLLESNLLASLPGSFPKVVISHKELPLASLPNGAILFRDKELRFTHQLAQEFSDELNSSLSTDYIGRLITLLEGRSAVLEEVFFTIALLGREYVQRTIKCAKSGDDLLTEIAKAYLATMDSNRLQTLILELLLGYGHPQLSQAVFGKETVSSGPWAQSLADHWMRVRCHWRPSLRKLVRIGSDFKSTSLRRTADFLVQQGDVKSAINLYLDVGDFPDAAQNIVIIGERMMDLGQWVTLGNWLAKLPFEIMNSWPSLVYMQGEIQAACNHTAAARRSFVLASDLFTNRHDQEGACQSLLAESAVASWEGDKDRAWISATTAGDLANTANLPWARSLSGWQLGCLADSMNESSDTLTYFTQSAEQVIDPFLKKMFSNVQALAQKQQELLRQRELHRQALLDVEQSDRELSDQLHSIVNSLPENLPTLLEARGWSKTPLIFKLHLPPSPGDDSKSEKVTAFGDSFLRRLRSLIPIQGRETQKSREPLCTLDFPAPIPTLDGGGLADYSDANSMPKQTTRSALYELPSSPQLEQGKDLKFPEKAAKTISLVVHTLGVFSVTLDGFPLTLPNSRASSLFVYLMLHHKQNTPREVLMDLFWPDLEPESARNNLNVALHSLRQVFRSSVDIPVIEFSAGVYQLCRNLDVWIDIDEFEHHQQSGIKLEAAGQIAAAVKDYEIAASLYQGDFLQSDLYEDWSILTREHLRVAYLDILDRLSRIYFKQGQYAACISLCQLILGRDNCREDTHCLLMRCYCHQGQHYLALRQYQACVEALRTELDVDPASETTQLYERIRRHELI